MALAWALSFGLVALLYASVGQAGATVYLALMGWAGLPADSMKVAALSLNVAVAGIATLGAAREGRLALRSAWPFLALGVPGAALGGALQLPDALYRPAVGAVLLLAAWRMWRLDGPAGGAEPSPPRLGPALAAGGVVGLVSGTIGTGGGIFLAPLLLTLRWSDARGAASLAAVQNLAGSAAGLAGARALWPEAPDALPLWIACAALGGIAGTALAHRFLPEAWLRRILAGLLAVAGVRLLLG